MSVDLEVSLINRSFLNQEVVPAVDSFLQQGNARHAKRLVAQAIDNRILRHELGLDFYDYLVNESLGLLDGRIPEEILDETTGETVRDARYIRKYWTERTLSRLLILLACVQDRKEGPFTYRLSRGDLAHHVRSHSHFFDEMLSLSNNILWDAEPLVPGTGSDAWVLSNAQTSVVLKELVSIPAGGHNSELLKQFAGLQSLLQQADRDPDYLVLIRTW